MKKRHKPWRVIPFIAMGFWLLLSFIQPTTVMAGDISYPEKLAHFKTYLGELKKGQPEVINAFYELHHASVKPGALDTKVKELIGLAIAVAVRCDPCIAAHTNSALKAGATAAEIMETLSVSILMGGGPAVAYATHAMEAMEQFKKTEK